MVTLKLHDIIETNLKAYMFHQINVSICFIKSKKSRLITTLKKIFEKDKFKSLKSSVAREKGIYLTDPI